MPGVDRNSRRLPWVCESFGREPFGMRMKSRKRADVNRLTRRDEEQILAECERGALCVGVMVTRDGIETTRAGIEALDIAVARGEPDLAAGIDGHVRRRDKSAETAGGFRKIARGAGQQRERKFVRDIDILRVKHTPAKRAA